MNFKNLLWLLVWGLIEAAALYVISLYDNEGWRASVICALAVGFTIYTAATGKVDIRV